MLTDLIHELRSYSFVPAWLRTQLPRKPVEQYIEDDELVFCFKDETKVGWSSGRILKLLSKSDPKAAVPLLWELCCRYDLWDDTSRYLRQALREKGLKLEPVPFYRQAKVLFSVKLGKQSGKTLDGVEISVDNGSATVKLFPTEWLRDLLLSHLMTVAI